MTAFARTLVLPIISAGILGGVALGLAGSASADTTGDGTGSSFVYSPDTYASPAPSAHPGWQSHHGVGHEYLMEAHN